MRPGERCRSPLPVTAIFRVAFDLAGEKERGRKEVAHCSSLSLLRTARKRKKERGERRKRKGENEDAIHMISYERHLLSSSPPRRRRGRRKKKKKIGLDEKKKMKKRGGKRSG